MIKEPIKKTPGEIEWFCESRFGMFIHWGLYSMPARHEWVKKDERISDDKYNIYAKYFNPDLFDPCDWAKRAKAAGMQYVVITAKHHEGYCMFDSKYTDFKCTNSPAGRDLLKECIDAFRAEGIRIGLYYSLLDWHHPDFTIDKYHPRSNDPNAAKENENKDMKRYCQYMRDQVTELLTNYGKIDILWFDFSYETEPSDDPAKCGKGAKDWEAEELIATARALQPHVLIDNRTGIDQDIWTPEQEVPDRWPRHASTGELVPWESCMTLSGSWGYHRDEKTWKSPELLISMLIKSVSLGGNFIMNIGPNARGYLSDKTKECLKVYEDWMSVNSRSIYGCGVANEEFTAPEGCLYTQSNDGKRLYVHLLQYPFINLELKNLAYKVEYAQFLHDGSELLFNDEFAKNDFVDIDNIKRVEGSLFVKLPPVKPNVLYPVIELMLK